MCYQKIYMTVVLSVKYDKGFYMFSHPKNVPIV